MVGAVIDSDGSRTDPAGSRWAIGVSATIGPMEGQGNQDQQSAHLHDSMHSKAVNHVSRSARYVRLAAAISAGV